jgi:hypothetical protein
MEKQYYIAINSYRSSTSEGFCNTWTIYRCSKETQRRLLTEGLPVRDQCYLDNDGAQRAMYSTMGIRVATPAERKRAASDPHLPVFEREYHDNED